MLRINTIFILLSCYNWIRDVEGQYMVEDGSVPKMPKTKKGAALNVFVGIYVENMGNIRTSEMDYELDIYLTLNWRDPAHRHNQSRLRLENDANILKEFWLPDLYFANAMDASFQSVTIPNFALYVDRDGTISYSTRVMLRVACNLDLTEYPLDEQTCNLKIMSYAYTTQKMLVQWFSESPIKMNDNIDLAEYVITGHNSGYCGGEFTYGRTAKASKRGNFSCLLGTFELKRSIGYHLSQSYIPSGLNVIVSWTSFWIDRNAVPARVALTCTTLVTVAALGTGMRYSLPPVSYAKAIDYWYGCCLLFVFGSLIEFTIVNSLMRRGEKRNKKKKASMERRSILSSRRTTRASTRYSAFEHDISEAENLMESDFEWDNSADLTKTALAMDQTCRYAFPLTFLFFNIIYWLHYLYD